MNRNLRATLLILASVAVIAGVADRPRAEEWCDEYRGILFLGTRYIEPPYEVTVDGRRVLVNGEIYSKAGPVPETFSLEGATEDELHRRWMMAAGYIYAELLASGMPEPAAADSVQRFIDATPGAGPRYQVDTSGEAGCGGVIDLFDSTRVVEYDPRTSSPARHEDARYRSMMIPARSAAQLRESLCYRSVKFSYEGSSIGIGARDAAHRDQIVRDALAFFEGKPIVDQELAGRLERYLAGYERKLASGASPD